ncbi:MAG: KH domain-containing protein [Candidatus Thorarchaeota archaeon]
MSPTNESGFSNLNMFEIVRVPNDRLGVIIGKKGSTKIKIEELTSTQLTIDSKDNSVTIQVKKELDDPSFLWTAKDMIRAIGRGFSEKIAFTLIDPNVFLRVITLEDTKNKKRLYRIRGRLIGENGKARRIIEEVTKCNISIYGNTVSIIGRIDDGGLDASQEAIEMIIKGVKHTTMYKFLEKWKSAKKIEDFQIWKVRDDVSFDKMWEKIEQDAKNEQKTDKDGTTSMNGINNNKND